MNKTNKAGRVVSVQGPVVDVKFQGAEDVPNIYRVINTRTVDGGNVVLEVAEHLPGNLARCISINSTINIQRNQEALVVGNSIQIPAGDMLYGRIWVTHLPDGSESAVFLSVNWAQGVR